MYITQRVTQLNLPPPLGRTALPLLDAVLKTKEEYIMQKRAARRGTRALAFLLCLLMVVTLLPVMGASAAEGLQPSETVTAIEGLKMSKQLTLMTDGTYTIDLEAYATGVSQTVTQKSGTPLDIVLVIDQSGSMAYNDGGSSTDTASDRRMYKLQEAVRSFVNNISANAKEFDVEHKIAMVGYASNLTAGPSSEWNDRNSTGIKGIGHNGSDTYWVNTGLYVNGAFKNYQTNIQTGWGGSVTSATDLTAQDYKDALVSVNDANGNVAESITSSINLFKASGGTYTEYGMTMAQNIFKNNPIRSYTKEDGTTVQSQRIVVLFTDGETNSDINTVLTSANTLKGNTYGATIYCVGFGSSVNTDFLSHVSSNYNSASYGWISTGMWDGYYDYSGTQVATKYSMTANNKDELDNIFTNISKDVTQSSSSTELTEAAVLKDIISENFDVTNAEVSAASYKVTTTDGITYTTGAEVQDYDAALNKDTKTVDVTGFNYKEKYVAVEHAGEKLVVTITGLLPNQAGETLYSNDNEKSGIYTQDTDETPFASFDKPYTTVNTETRVVDFGMTVQIGSNVLNTNAATQQYGTFSLNSNKVYTYNLNSVKDGNGNYTFGFTGVDSALYYTDAQWTKVNVIPANNVYYDDDLLNKQSTFTDGDYGYDVNVPDTTGTTPVQPENGENMAVRAFTFTGSRIDLYCTTADDTRTVTAAIYKTSEYEANPNSEPIRMMAMNNRYQSGTLYNVPTLSFDMETRDTYTVVLYASATANYQLDGIRVYNPGSADVDAMYEAGEQNATFLKVRDLLLNADDGQGSFGEINGQAGVVYVDNINKQGQTTADIGTYQDIGPKNEVYLANGNAIAFKVDGYQAGMKVMVGLSAPEDANSQVTMSNGTGTKEQNVQSYIDMYYEVTPNADGYVVIQNTGDSLISVTNVKVSGTADGAAATLSVDDGLLTYMASFNSLEVTEPDAEPDPTPDTTPNQTTITATINAIWNRVMNGIAKLFGRL